MFRRLRTLFTVVIIFAVTPSRAFWWGPSSKSAWLDRTITIDGNADDWKAQDQDDAEGLTYAFTNDDKNLYILVAPHTKSIKKQMAGSYGQDFIIWLDPKTGKNKRVGIKLHAPTRSSTARDVEVAIDTISMAMPQVNDTAEIAMGPTDERGVLEARIPLTYLGSSLPKTISVGFETSRPDKVPNERKPSTGGGEGAQNPSNARRGGRSGGKGGGRSKQSSNSAGEDFSPVQLWVRLKLASAPRKQL